MVRPCVARVFGEIAVSGLASMYPASIGACCAPGHHGYQRACVLISGQASTGHSGHQCSHAPGRPILHLVLSSRRPRRVTRIDWLCHRELHISRGCYGRRGRMTIRQVGQPHRSSSLRSSGHEPERSRRYGPACWRVRSQGRCGAAASWRPRSTA